MLPKMWIATFVFIDLEGSVGLWLLKYLSKDYRVHWQTLLLVELDDYSDILMTIYYNIEILNVKVPEKASPTKKPYT